MHQTPIYHIAIFASGTGSNAEKIMTYFKSSDKISIALLVSNNKEAGVLNIAKKNKIPIQIIEKENFFKGDAYLSTLEKHQINFIVLAGFLWKIPVKLIHAFPHAIINIHPALLPDYGGKGMYGMHVHESVIAHHEKQSGITIHYVDEIYDHGKIIFQEKCKVEKNETPESLATKIHELEHTYFAPEIEKLLLSK
ncbi:MAG: phosphoribosylglycinamide formyltransferase [Chitinophagaceae bacterium]